MFHKAHIGDYENLFKCPECDEERYQPDTTILRKRFKYLPLEMQIRRMFADQKTSQLLQSHGEPNLKSTDSNKTNSIHQSEDWKDMYSLSGIFEGDSHGLSFAICMDGLNLFFT